jgi:class 3 adenylate cyclase/transcriptional regulator with XRE-family HTH domain
VVTEESFGSLVRRYRRDAELSQEALAERAGLSIRAIRDIEAGGRHRPRQDTIDLLLAALAVPEEEQAHFRAAGGQRASPAPPAADGRAVDRHVPSREPIPAVRLPAPRDESTASRDSAVTTIPCPACGRQTDEASAFCPHCGASLTAAAPEREQRKRVTVLFCDVTGSTALGDTVDPEVLRALLARYHTRMKGIIESHGGTVEKFIGDAVMAVFGVPQLHEDDALRAMRAAHEMQAALPELGLQARIGLNSGEVVTGTGERLATGDAINVAARLEQAADPGTVLLGEATVELVREAVEIEAVPPLLVKGKAEPVVAYRLLGVRPSGERSMTTPMIGRERELRRLEDAFAQAVQDHSCQLFTIEGMAGVGKSRLVAEFLRDRDGARVVRGRCLPYGEGITYWPVVEVLRQLDRLPGDALAASALRSLVQDAPVPASAEEIAWGFRKLLEEEAQEQPLVVVFDDIHWGEESFLDLIEHVADLSRDAPMLLLCMARPELLDRRPGWGGGKWNATTVLLEPLTTAETDRLLEMLGGVEEGLRTRIQQAAEGNPLFVEEMVALVRASGGGVVSVPPTIQALLAARLDQLASSERSVLECGSVEGRVFHQSALRVLLEDETNLPARLVALVRKELVRPARAQLTEDDAYRFRHLLIRDAAYDALPKSVRAELHQRFARWLQDRGTELIELDEIVGYHLEQAAAYKHELGQPDLALAERAGERLAAAGQRALARGDTRAARGLFERTLTLLRPIRLDLYVELDLADLLPPAEGAALAHAAADRARAANDRCGEAVARVAAEHCLAHVTGLADELEVLARAALPLAQEAADHAGLVRVWAALGEVTQTRGLYEGEALTAEQAIAEARLANRPSLSGWRTPMTMVAFGLPIALIHGPRPAAEALKTLDALFLGDAHPGARLSRAVPLAMIGRVNEARLVAAEASAQLRERTGDYGGEEFLIFLAAVAGDDEDAARYARASRDQVEARGQTAALSTYAPLLGRSLCMLGQYEEAEPLAQLGRELGHEDDWATQSLWRQVQALVCSQRGEHEEAELLAREAVAIIDGTDSLMLQGDVRCDLGEVLERAGRQQEAVAVLKEALDRYERKGIVPLAARVRQRLAVLEGALPAAES